MATSNRSGGHVKATGTAFQIVEVIQESNGAGITELSNRLDMPKSTVHDHVNTLEKAEYLVKRPDNTYDVGLKLLDHGMYARNEIGLSRVVNPALGQIADETGEVVWFTVEAHGRLVFLSKAVGRHGVQTIGRIGKRCSTDIHATGKAILAAVPRASLEAIVERHGLPASTDRTITDTDVLLDELDRIRERGYALNEGESVDSVRSVGAAVVANEKVQGAIGLAAPRIHMSDTRIESEIADLLPGAVNELELKLEYGQSSVNAFEGDHRTAFVPRRG